MLHGRVLSAMAPGVRSRQDPVQASRFGFSWYSSKRRTNAAAAFSVYPNDPIPLCLISKICGLCAVILERNIAYRCRALHYCATLPGLGFLNLQNQTFRAVNRLIFVLSAPLRLVMRDGQNRVDDDAKLVRVRPQSRVLDPSARAR